MITVLTMYPCFLVIDNGLGVSVNTHTEGGNARL